MLIRRVTHSASRFPTATIRRFALTVIAIAAAVWGIAIQFGAGYGLIALAVGCLLLDFTAEDDNEGPPS